MTRPDVRAHVEQILRDAVITAGLPDNQTEQILLLVSDVMALLGGGPNEPSMSELETSAEILRRVAKNFLIHKGWVIDGRYWNPPPNEPELARVSNRTTWVGALLHYQRLLDDPAPYAAAGEMIRKIVAQRKADRDDVDRELAASARANAKKSKR